MTDPDSVVAEFAEHLAQLAREYAGKPDAELEVLWRVGLEREAIVTVAYRHDAIGQRLRKMALPDDARTVIARAVRWAWRDEQAHTLWIRGAHVRWAQLADAVAAQTRGQIGGWVSSTQHHLTWTQAPARRALAEAVELAGRVTGRIPPAVRGSLRWSTFSDLCKFNHAAERTAGLAWRRMTELAGAHPDAAGFARMAADEDRHAKVFAILAAAFDGDRLVIDAATLRAQLHGVGQRFVAVPDPDRPAWSNPLGKGATVVVRGGDDPHDAIASALLATGIADKLRPGTVVALKTTFMLVTRRANLSPGVTPSVLAAVIAWFEERGARVRVIDARNMYDVFHAGRGVHAVARHLAITGDIVDAQDEQVPHDYARGLGVTTISRTWRDADVRVLLGKLRSHPTSAALLSLEAAEGLAARHDELLFLERRAERETAVVMALDAAPPDVALLDAWSDVPDGLLGVLGSERPLEPRRIYASTDAVALDTVACRHIGADPEDPAMLLSAAFDWFGDPRGTTTVDGLTTPIEDFRLPDHSPRTAFLAALALPVFTFASGRGALFLPDFDETAFPPIATSRVSRLARSLIRRIVADPPRGDRSAPLLPTAQLATKTGEVRIARVGRGAPVVFLHGYPETLQAWSAVVPRLGDRECIAFDWPGLGGSAPHSGPATPAALADQLRDVLDAAALDRVDLVATDMGGPPALVFAASYPDRVRRVIVMGSLLFGDAPTSLDIAAMRRAKLARTAFRFAPSIVYARCKRTFLAGGALPAALDADFAGAFMLPTVRTRLAEMCEAYETALPDLPSSYWQIRAPVHLVWGEHEAHFPIEHAERLQAILPGTRVEVLPAGDHWMMISRPAEVAQRLADILGGNA